MCYLLAFFSWKKERKNFFEFLGGQNFQKNWDLIFFFFKDFFS